MRRSLVMVLLAAVATGLMACSGDPSPTANQPSSYQPPALIALPTLEPEPTGEPRPCMAALIRGTLVANAAWGLALTGSDGLTRKVVWPFGFAARRDSDRLVLLDASRSVVAREGDQVEIGGGETGDSQFGPEGTWIGCGGVKVVAGP